MGIKLGDPKRNVIAVLGDGAYILNNPYSAHYVQSWYDLPIFTVLLNDSAWGAMKDGVVQYSGDQGYYKRHDLAGVDFPTKLRLGEIAKGFGLTTFTIEEASTLISTMKKAYSMAKSGKHVLVDVNVGNLPGPG
jgi:acetolactate synthase-1/2/3 large subunit